MGCNVSSKKKGGAKRVEKIAFAPFFKAEAFERGGKGRRKKGGGRGEGKRIFQGSNWKKSESSKEDYRT